MPPKPVPSNPASQEPVPRFADRLRAHIREMEAYTPILPFEVLSEQLHIPADQIIKLDANENPYGALPQVRAALASLAYAHIYPDPESRALRRAIGAHYGLPVDNILAGAGADELIDLILRVLVDPGEPILNCPPTFGMYAFDAQLQDAGVISVARKAGFALDEEAIRAAVECYRPKVMFLANPNNPDGSLAPPALLERLLGLDVILVVDEAYIDFAPAGASLLTGIAAGKRIPDNLVVLRTFSKWAGLAGLRVGFGVFPDWLLPHLWKAKQPYNVSVAAAAAAITSLAHAGELEANAQKIKAERGYLAQALAEIPWLAPYPSQANFILCRVLGREASEVKAGLAQKGILTRYFNKPGLEDHLRISVGLAEDTRRVVAALRAL